MSAHRTLNDLSRAFDSIGPGRLEDPGDTKTITFTQWGQICSVVTAAAETRTLAQPTKPGIFACVALDVYVGALTLTVTGGFNADGDTSITFGTAGDFVVFYSIKVGTSYYWRVLAQEGTNVAAEDLAVDQLTASTLTLNGLSVAPSNMTPGTGVSAGVGVICEHSVIRIGDLYKTEILVDLTGLNSGGTDGDIIGVHPAAANCHIGQITAAKNGTIFAGKMTCLEVPAGGSDDIDLNAATESTGAEDTGIGALTETVLVNAGGAWTLALVKALAAYPAADKYLYLSGNTGDATYTAGIFLIELWGK